MGYLILKAIPNLHENCLQSVSLLGNVLLAQPEHF